MIRALLITALVFTFIPAQAAFLQLASAKPAAQKSAAKHCKWKRYHGRLIRICR